MRRMIAGLMVVFLVSLSFAQQNETTNQATKKAPAMTTSKNQTTAPIPLKSWKDSLSYFIGFAFGSNILPQLNQLQNDSIDLNMKNIIAGLSDILENREPRLAKEDLNRINDEFKKILQGKTEAAKKKIAEKNKIEGEKFLEENAKKDSIHVTASGLQYKILREGTGPKPADSSSVRVNYKGMLPDGTVFDSSYDRGEPATFPVKGVIPGWTEALELMNVGSKYELFIPAKLAYGEQGAGEKIGPNSVLIFEVELLDIVK